MPADSGERTSPLRWQKTVVAVVAAVVVVHSIVLAVWLAPTSPVREALGGGQLSSYVDPYFQQSWSGFEPSAQYVDETFRIRAHLREPAGDGTYVSEWVDLSAEQTEAMRHKISPARVDLASRRLATNLNNAMLALDPGQRSLVATNYIETPIDKLAGRLGEAGADADAVRRYIATDRMAVGFASSVADARWEGTVLEVQFLVGRRLVPAYSQRDERTLDDVDYSWFVFGWRQAERTSPDAQSAFSSYLEG